MRYVDEFRDPELITKASDEIHRLADTGKALSHHGSLRRPHHAIYRFGLKDVLPSNIELIHGPGCPVCVLPMGRIDDGLAVARNADVIFAAFGDMMRVPAHTAAPSNIKRGEPMCASSILRRMLFSLRERTPTSTSCSLRIGFETTAPSTALTLMRAKAEGIENFSVFCNHVTIVPAIRAILDSPDMRLDAFIGPGHVSTVIGCRPYEWIARNEGKPVVTSGFEPLDLLQSIVMLLRQLHAGEARVENQYKRVVPWEGNRAALKAMAEVFQLRPYFEWRGLGFISQSALKIRDEYAEVGCRAALPNSRHPGNRSQGRTVRRSAQGRAEACAVQAVWQGMHSGTSNRRAYGFLRGFMRSILQLRTSQGSGNGDPSARWPEREVCD